MSKIGQIEADFHHFFPYSETILEKIFVDFQNISLKCTSISNQLGLVAQNFPPPLQPRTMLINVVTISKGYDLNPTLYWGRGGGDI